MADAIVVGQQDPQGPQGGKVSKKVVMNPSAAVNNPVVRASNVGAPDQPVRQMAHGVEVIMGEVNAQGTRTPQRHEEITPPESGIPGAKPASAFTRTDW